MGDIRTTVTCYDILSAACVKDGAQELTEGIYYGNPLIPYQEAKSNQLNWLLDQVHCESGSVILDIGCGNGSLLREAGRRGAIAIGLTLSPQQASYCSKRGLNAQVMNYRHIPLEWNNAFTGVIANGSLEHFVQVEDVIDGRADEIYREMFEIAYRVLVPRGMFATTAIHCSRNIDPMEMLKGANAHPRGSDNHQYARILIESLGGWYPGPNQLERCAQGLFKHIERVDGTQDYHFTSEHWLADMKLELSRPNPKAWFNLVKKLIKHPIATSKMIDTLFFTQAWAWQFRLQANGNTPNTLYRDVWEKVN